MQNIFHVIESHDHGVCTQYVYSFCYWSTYIPSHLFNFLFAERTEEKRKITYNNSNSRKKIFALRVPSTKIRAPLALRSLTVEQQRPLGIMNHKLKVIQKEYFFFLFRSHVYNVKQRLRICSRGRH